MRQIDGEVLAADVAGERVVVLLGKTPDGPKILGMRHDRVGTVTAVMTDVDLDVLIVKLQALRADGGAAFDLVVADIAGAPMTIGLGRTADGARTVAISHPIGTVTAAPSDDALDELIAELQALRAEAA